MDRDRPLGVLAERQARHSEHGGFLLHASGVREHQLGAVHHIEELAVAEGLDQVQVREAAEAVAEAVTLQHDPGARVGREDDRHPVLHRLHDVQEGKRVLEAVDVGRPMHGHQRVGARRQAESADQLRPSGVGSVAQQRIDHDVPHEEDLLRSHALASEMIVRFQAGGEAEIGDRVGEDAIDLLGHEAVAAAQARLDVGDGDRQLGGGQRARQGRIHVAHHHQQIGPLGEQHRLHRQQHPRGLLGMRTGPDAEVDVGRTDLQVREERIRERRIVVLAGVDQPDVDRRARRALALERAQDRRDLHEIGARSHHAHDSHRAPTSDPSSSRRRRPCASRV